MGGCGDVGVTEEEEEEDVGTERWLGEGDEKVNPLSLLLFLLLLFSCRVIRRLKCVNLESEGDQQLTHLPRGYVVEATQSTP